MGREPAVKYKIYLPNDCGVKERKTLRAALRVKQAYDDQSDGYFPIIHAVIEGGLEVILM